MKTYISLPFEVYNPQGGSSEWSDSLIVNTAEAAGTEMGIPQMLSPLYVGSTSVTIQWEDTSDPYAPGFRVQWQEAGTDTWNSSEAFSINTTIATITGLTPGTLYNFRVRAWVNDQSTEWSDLAVVKTSAPVANEFTPDAPSGLTATQCDDQSVSLAWTDNADNETAFRVRWSSDGVNWSSEAILAPNAENAVIGNLDKETVYYFQVRSYNPAGGSSEWSEMIKTSTLQIGPTDFAVVQNSITDTSVELTWDKIAENIDKYRIRYSTVPNDQAWQSDNFNDWDSVSFVTNINETGKETYLLENLTPDTTYYLQIRSWDADSPISVFGLSSLWSDVIIVKTLS